MFALGGFFGYSTLNINIKRTTIMIIKIYNQAEFHIYEGVKEVHFSHERALESVSIFHEHIVDKFKGCLIIDGVAHDMAEGYTSYICNDNGKTVESIVL